MNIIETLIPGLFVIEPRIFADERGYFFESYNENNFKENGLVYQFVQDNESKSQKGVVRGLHYQLEPHAQTKLVRAVQGVVYDVAVDLREDSPTYGKWFGVELSAENKKQFYIPKGFAHGFSVLSDEAVFAYKCDSFYHSASERGIIYNEPKFGIDWQIDTEKAIVSSKDLLLPSFDNAEKNFKF